MHFLIRVLVYAPDSESALIEARKIIYKKMEWASLEGIYDSAVDFTKDEFGGVAGIGRYGSLDPVLQVSTARFPTDDKRGVEMAYAALEDYRKAFKYHLTLIRHHLGKYTDDELFEEVEGKGYIEIDGDRVRDDPSDFREYCSVLCGREGPYRHLYDSWGCTITKPKVLQRILADSDSNPWYFDFTDGQYPNWGRHIWNQPLWIVPYDVHY